MYYLFTNTDWSKSLSLVVFLPQIIIWITSAFKFSRHIELVCFVHTFTFVAFNKVCTSQVIQIHNVFNVIHLLTVSFFYLQYFLWYLSLLPLITPFLKISYLKSTWLIGLWIVSQVG